MIKFEYKPIHKNVSEEDLLDDLKKVHSLHTTKGRKMPYRSYSEEGKYHAVTYRNRFGSWNNALKKA